MLIMRGGARRRRSRSRRAGCGQYAGVQEGRGSGRRYIFKEAKEIGDSFTLAVGQHRVVDAVLGASCVRFD